MSEFPFDFNDDDVISIDPQYTDNQSKLLRMSWFKDTVERLLGSIARSWLGEGVPCEILRVGGSWEKGRVRIRLEYVPDKQDKPTPGPSDAVRPPSPEQ